MREIFLILSMLLLGLFSAKAFGAYTPDITDVQLLQTLESKVTTLSISDPAKLSKIQEKLPLILPSLSSDTQARYILNELFLLIQHQNNSKKELNNPSPALIKVLADEF